MECMACDSKTHIKCTEPATVTFDYYKNDKKPPQLRPTELCSEHAKGREYQRVQVLNNE